MNLPRLYTEFTSWWPLISTPQDFAEESQFSWQTWLNLLDQAGFEAEQHTDDHGHGVFVGKNA